MKCSNVGAPLVSIVIPVYNREKFIGRAINSVLQQSYKNLELIIVDDCSHDDSLKVIRSFKDKRIKVIALEQNSGANVARNKGIMASRGEYIAFQDSDDEWLPDKLFKQIAYMQQNDCKACYCPYELHDEDITVVPQDYLDRDKYEKRINALLTYTNAIGTPCLIVEKAVLQNVGGFDEEMPSMQDYELAIRIAQCYKIGYCPEILVKVYRQKDSITMQKDRHRKAVARIIQKHKDFVDLNAMLLIVYRGTSFFERDKIDWNCLLDLQRESGLGQRFDEMTLNYLHKKYNTVETLLDFLQKRQWRIFETTLHSGEFAIYGAGRYAKKIAAILREKGLIPKCFLVTQLQKEIHYLDGILIDNLKEEYRCLPILIGTNFENQKEICQILDERHFDNYCTYPVYDFE